MNSGLPSVMLTNESGKSLESTEERQDGPVSWGTTG